MRQRLISNFFGLVGAAVGGALGFYIFQWLYNHGFLGLAVPGALLGVGCGALARHPSLPRGIACAVAALALSLYAEASTYLAPENTIAFAVTHLKDEPVSLLMIVLGTLIAFWTGKDAGRYGAWPVGRARPEPLSKPPGANQQPPP